MNRERFFLPLEFLLRMNPKVYQTVLPFVALSPLRDCGITVKSFASSNVALALEAAEKAVQAVILSSSEGSAF
jgi:hypothetical protein